MMSIKEQFSYDFHGMNLSQMVKHYSAKNVMPEALGIKGYKTPLFIPLNKMKSLSTKDLVGYKELKFKKDRTFMGRVIEHAKQIPPPNKYNKILKWSTDGSQRGKFNKDKRITLFTEIAKDSKKMPGPCSYNQHKAKDKFIL